MATIYNIRDLESLSGIKAHTIRIWEQRYGILKAGRTETNIRYYSEHDLRHLMSLAFLNRNGFKISKLAHLSDTEVSDLVGKMMEVPAEFNNQIDGLTMATIDYDEEKFERIIDTCILQMGFEETIRRVVVPFLQRLGMLWVSGTVIAGQEHFMTQLLRQKILVAIDGQPRLYKSDAKKFLLFLPNGEWHELSLLFLSYLLKTRSYRVIYLGPSVPLNDVISVAETQQPDCFYTIMTVTPTGFSVQEYLQKLAGHFPSSKVMVSGNQVMTPPKNLPANVYIINDLYQAMDQVAELVGATENV